MTQRIAITGRTRLFVMLADPIEPVSSPAVYNSLFQAAGVDAVMVPCGIAAADLESAWTGFGTIKNFDGALISMPHKTSVFSYCDVLTPAAQLAGAVNAIRRDGDRWIGGLFDGIGFVAALRARAWEGVGQSAALIGCGGAGAAIAFALADAGVRRLNLIDRDADKAVALGRRLKDAFPNVSCCVADPELSRFDLIVNASPLGGEATDTLSAATRQLRPGQIVADIVIAEEVSPLLVVAGKIGCAVVNGREMLLAQVQLIWDFLGLPLLVDDQLARSEIV